jgi:hypothetical protein
MKWNITAIYARMHLKKDILYQVTVPILNGTPVMWLRMMKQEGTMAVDTIIVVMLAFIAVMTIFAWFFDQWRNNDDDDWEPYG